MSARTHIVGLVACLAAGCPRSAPTAAPPPHPTPKDSPMLVAAPPSGPAYERYLTFVRKFGVTDPGQRLGDFAGLARGEVRFFALRETSGWILKAAASPTGLVEPGLRATDDWRGYFDGLTDAAAAAVGLAWLETDEAPAHGVYVVIPVEVLDPARRPEARSIDPAHWALVRPPTLGRDAQGTTRFEGWFLRAGAQPPERWTIVVPAVGTTLIERESAAELAPPSDAKARARTVLQSGTLEERRWAMNELARSGDRAAVADLAAVLASGPPELHKEAVFALSDLHDATAVPAIARALRADPAAEVRRAAAEALRTFHSADAIAALGEAASAEPEPDVRLSIVHALGEQGPGAVTILKRIAKDDRDPDIRKLARTYADRNR